jgi:carboxylesterase
MSYLTDRKAWFVNPHLDGGSFFWSGGEVGILLLHGFTATTVEVQPLARALHQHGFTVAGPLLPGHGTTLQEANRIHWSDWLTCAAETYQSLSRTCKILFVGGESMGALLAILIARQFPQTSGLMLYAPAYYIPGLARARWLSLLFSSFPKTYARNQPQERYPWQGYSAVPLKAAVQLLRLQREVRKYTSQITQPTLIFQGRLDRTVDPQGAAALFAELAAKEKELIWLEKSHHCVIIDHEFDTVVSHTLAFLEKHSQSILHPSRQNQGQVLGL